MTLALFGAAGNWVDHAMTQGGCYIDKVEGCRATESEYRVGFRERMNTLEFYRKSN
jgi:hypothetical protein